jgi:GntR family transcriptional regulator
VNIFQFLKQFCEVEPYLDLTEIHPAIADEKLAKKMNIPESTLLIKMEEVDYDLEGIPIFYSKQYFVDDLISHTVLRKKI